jgi:hypothetical protein
MMGTIERTPETADPVSRPAYEPPVLTPIGNLHSIVAGSTQALICDGTTPQPGAGDHNPAPTC